jgi:hypothetical protein
MVVQDIVNAVSTDTRQVLAPSGNDAQVILNWVDRVQKEILHTTLYINQNLATTSINTSLNTNSYNLTPATPIRRIVSIYDTTFNMSLKPADADLDQPSPTQSNVDEQQGRAISTSVSVSPHQAYKFGGTPEYFRFIAPTTLLIRPAPPLTGFLSTLSITYEQLIETVTSLSTELIVPDDGKDIMVAGVNWLAMAYIGRAQEAMSWFQLYQQLKAGNRTGVIR